MRTLHITEDDALDWLEGQCGVCLELGCRLWIAIRCKVARRIIWNNGTFSAEDVRLMVGEYGYPEPCRHFELDEERQQQVQEWLEGVKA